MTKTGDSSQTEPPIECPYYRACDWYHETRLNHDICRYAYEKCNMYKKIKYGDVPYWNDKRKYTQDYLDKTENGWAFLDTEGWPK